ncbi:methyltransferase domain-containing protein [Elioraea sp.]|uniref:methyltransferase domain-containing protein n=1 Tax=Elioraea sp. TaxID=2185103 RepID=UPI003F717368
MAAIPQPFDRRAHRLSRDRAAALVDRAEPLLAAVADRMLDRLDDTTRRFTRALDLGGRHGLLARALHARGIPVVVSADLSPRMAARAGGLAVAADEEWLPFAPGAFDLIVSALSLHWVNDLPGAMIQLRQALRPDGLFLAILPGPATLAPLRAAFLAAEAATSGGASPRVIPLPDLRDAASLLQRAGFALPVADAETLTVTYPDPFALFAELRALGETNALAARSRRPATRALIAEAARRLPRDSEGRIALPLELITLTGWAPAASQPRPLAPGSGAARLAAALGADEQGAGELAPSRLAPPKPAR